MTLRFLAIPAIVLGLSSCALQNSTLASSPVRYALASMEGLNAQSLGHCIEKNEAFAQADVRVTQRRSDEYVVQISGRDLNISNGREGVWEEVSFAVLALPGRVETTLLMAGLRGKSTFSNSSSMPPSGPRWEAFTDEQQALAVLKMELIFVQVGQCIENDGAIA